MLYYTIKQSKVQEQGAYLSPSVVETSIFFYLRKTIFGKSLHKKNTRSVDKRYNIWYNNRDDICYISWRHKMQKLIKSIREYLGLSQADFAEKLGVTFATVNR